MLLTFASWFTMPFDFSLLLSSQSNPSSTLTQHSMLPENNFHYDPVTVLDEYSARFLQEVCTDFPPKRDSCQSFMLQHLLTYDQVPSLELVSSRPPKGQA